MPAVTQQRIGPVDDAPQADAPSSHDDQEDELCQQLLQLGFLQHVLANEVRQTLTIAHT